MWVELESASEGACDAGAGHGAREDEAAFDLEMSFR